MDKGVHKQQKLTTTEQFSGAFLTSPTCIHFLFLNYKRLSFCPFIIYITAGGLGTCDWGCCDGEISRNMKF